MVSSNGFAKFVTERWLLGQYLISVPKVALVTGDFTVHDSDEENE